MVKLFSIKKSRRKVTLRAFTTVSHLAEHFAPVKLSQVTPEWWKKTPLTVADKDLRPGPPGAPPPSSELSFTVKHCYAIREVLATGIALRLWSDYQVTVMPSGQTFAQSPQPMKPGEQHPPTQYPGMLAGWAHHKFICPWLLFTEEPLHFYYAHPFYHYSNPGYFQVMPGVTEFHWQNHAHANCVFPVAREKREFSFKVGDVIAYLIPMEDVSIDIKAEKISNTDFNEMISSKQLSFHHHRLNKEYEILAVPKKKWKWPFRPRTR